MPVHDFETSANILEPPFWLAQCELCKVQVVLNQVIVALGLRVAKDTAIAPSRELVLH